MSKQNQTQNKQQAESVQDKPAKQDLQSPETAVILPFLTRQRIYADPRTLSAADAQTLQRTIGNQALSRLIIQRKMTLGPVGDKYEKEADAVAKQVVSKLHTLPSQSAPAKTTQRQEEEDELQMKPLPAISTLQRQEEEEEVQTKPLAQRQEEEEVQTKRDPMLAGGELNNDVESSVQSAKSGGQPIGDAVRQPMEQAFNADFSHIKIHTGNQSDSLNRSLSARAFASGQDVFFRSGEYNPNSTAGQELLAHELTHTIQQGAAPTSSVQRRSEKPKSNNPFLLGGLGFVSPNQIQRAHALANKNQPTYKPDPQDGEKVLNTSIRGTRRTNHTIGHYQNFTIADQDAPNKRDYRKITSAPFLGEFVYCPNFSQIIPQNQSKVVKTATHIKAGKSNAEWETAEPGDILEVTGHTEDNAYYLARNKRINDKRGSIAQEKTLERNNGLEAAGAVLTQTANAATTESNVPLYQPLSDDRQESVGINGKFGDFHRSGITLEVDPTAGGLDTSGENSLIVAQSVRQPNMKGYITQDKIRLVAETTAALTQEFQSQPDNQARPMLTVTHDVVITGKTMLRQPQKDGSGNITFKDSYTLDPGEILEHTPESRTIFKQDKKWMTEMKWRGKYLGMVNMDKAQRLADDQKAILKLNTAIAGPRARNSLQKVLVTEKTTLRSILTDRVHSFAVGPKTEIALKRDEVLYVDFSIKGVDEYFNYDWIFVQTENGRYGYVRQEKVTNPETEGQVREVVHDGQTIEGNAITDGNQYIYKINSAVGKRGDHLVPIPNRSLATHDYYRFIRNRRTNRILRVLRKNSMLASPPLTAVAAPNTESIVLSKAHLREPVIADRTSNSGVSDTKMPPPILPGDKLQINFQASGVFAKGDTEWYYAQQGNNTGYIRGASVRESSVGQLKEATQKTFVPNRFVPAYITAKAHLRDDKKKKKEVHKAGDQIMVNFGRHPLKFIKPQNSDDYVANPHFDASELDRWLLAQHQDDKPRYIRENKVTIQFVPPENTPPSAQKTSGAAYEAFKMFGGAVRDVNFEAAGGWGVGTTGDIYEGFKGVKGMQDGQEIESGFLKNPSQGPTHGGEYHNLAIAGVTGGLLGLMGTVEGLIEVFGPGRNWKERLMGMLKITQSGLSGIVASARAAENIYAIQDSRLKDSATASQSSNYEAFTKVGEVAGWAAGIANAINSIKGLFLSIHSFVTSHKKAPERGVGLLKGLLEAGQSGVKAARFLTKTFDASGASNYLAVAVPFIGIAIDMADIILGAFKTYHGHSSQTQATTLLERDTLKQNVIAAFGVQAGLDTSDPLKKEPNKLFWLESRGVRSVNTLLRKTDYHRLNPKIMFAIRNKENLDKRELRSDNVHERSPRYFNSDYYQVVNNQGAATGSVVAIINKHHIEITPESEKAIREYELVSKVQEVGKKKKIYGIEEIEKGILNLIGDVLGMSGPAAMSGAIIKGVTAAGDAGFSMARFINKQMDNRAGKKYASHLKYQGNIEGTDKSQTKKKREYYDHAVFIMQEIGALATPAKIVAVSQDMAALNLYKQQYSKVQEHVEMTGVHTKLFYESAGKPVDQVELIVEALSER